MRTGEACWTWKALNQRPDLREGPGDDGPQGKPGDIGPEAGMGVGPDDGLGSPGETCTWKVLNIGMDLKEGVTNRNRIAHQINLFVHWVFSPETKIQ